MLHRVMAGMGIAVAAGAVLAGTAGAGLSRESSPAIFLLIDEDSIDNGIPYAGHPGAAPLPGRQNISPSGPRRFTEADVNDRRASTTLRQVLKYFQDNVGRTVAVMTGDVGGEGWLAPNCVPSKWVSGSSNVCLPAGSAEAARGLSRFISAAVAQSRLDRIADVRPLRALGLESLEGQTVCAVVYDGDVSVNYGSSAPFQTANLQGATLGLVAFTIVDDGVNRMRGFSSATLPEAQLLILNAAEVCGGPLRLFTEAPVARSSSEPSDVDPHATADDRGYVPVAPPPPPLNAPPAITSAPVTTATLLEPYSYPVVASDPNADTLTYSLTAAPSGMTIDPATGAISWMPPGTGTRNVGVRVADSKGAAATQSFAVTVERAPNRPPDLLPVAGRDIPVGSPFRLRLAASDPDFGDVLTFGLVGAPAGARLIDGILEWTPGPGDIGSAAFTIDVHDAGGLGDSGAFTVQVVAANQPPTIEPQVNAAILAGASFARQINASDPNPGDTLTFSLVAGPSGLTMTGGGQVSWTPGAGQIGLHHVQVRVTDSGGLADAALFTIRVDAAPVAPPSQPLVANDDRYALRRNATLTVQPGGVLANDLNPGGGALAAQLATGAAKGNALLSADGGFTYTPASPPPGSTAPALAFELRRPNVDVTGVNFGPYVADLDGDGKPEILSHAQGAAASRRLDAVSGDGTVKFSIDVYQPSATPRLAIWEEFALGDLDGEGRIEIVGIDVDRQRLVALNHDGSFRWMSDNVEDGVNVLSSGGFFMPTIADIDGDGLAEILVSHRASGPAPLNTTQDYVTAYDSAGKIKWHCRGAADTSSAAEVIAADLNLDGRLELLFANDACDSSGQLLWSINVPTGSSIRDMAVANLDDDPFAEIVYLRGTEIRVYQHDGVIRGVPVTLPGSGVLSRPVVADVNGDGRPEILVARDDHIVILNRDLSVQRLIDVPDTWGGTPTVFDLDGDGKPEIIHHSAHSALDTTSPDPQFGALMIFDGSTGALLHAIAADRHSADELAGPIVADVDGDGSAAIVTRSWLEDFVTVRVFKAASGTWAKARPIWNQYAYNVTNINSDGTLPRQPIANWLTPGLNNYNVNEPLPSERTGTTDSFTYQATDGVLLSNVATVHLDVLPPNSAPRILSAPPAAATPGVEYLYGVRAADPDIGELLTYSLPQAPAGMTIESVTGLIRWTPATLGVAMAVVRVTDSQGEFDLQQIVIEVGPPVTVPSVTGMPLDAAKAALEASGLVAGAITNSPSADAPAGEVMTQEPAANANVAAGAAVSLVVSSGVPPVVVPNVVGKRITTARDELTALGFTVSVTRVYSPAVARGEVMQQSPPGGTLMAPGAVTLTESAGAGLALRLQRTFTPADESIPFSLVAYGLDGLESPPPAGVNLTVTAIQTPAIGSLPALNGSVITPAADTRGSFRITATDPATGRSASAEFGVTHANGGDDSMQARYAQMTSAMADIDALIRQGAVALESDDTPQMRMLLNQMVQRWKQVDMRLLSFAVPLAPETGFPLQPADLSGLGLTPTPDDLLADRVLKDAAADLQAWIEGLRTPSTTMAQLEALADRFGTRASRMRGLRMSEWGVINSQAVMAAIVSHRIPQLYDALMSELAEVVANNTEPEPEEGSSGPSAEAISTLSEQLTNIAMRIIVDKMQEHLSATYVSAKEYATNILYQAAWGAGAIAVSQHVKAWVHGQDVTATISGASMSFRVFGAANSMIEGNFEAAYPELNVVMLIGPDIISPLKPFIDQFKNTMQYGKNLDPNKSPRSLKQTWQELKAFYLQLVALQDSTVDVVEAIENAFQTPSSAFRGCLFSSASSCAGLVYPDGFKTVYTYTPPGDFGCQGFTGLPVPIIFLVYNTVTGTMYFDAPPFLPSPDPESGCGGK